jgi:hypothetical protein
MKLLVATISTLLVAATTSASPATSPPANTQGTDVSVTFDTAYDNPSLLLSTVACSNGEHGLVTKGFSTVGSLPTRFVGGAPTVAGWNSENCGACYSLTYNQTTVYVLAIDVAIAQFNVAQSAMDKLTGGHAAELGSVTAKYAPAQAKECGMK